ncbi:MAG: SusC/RagA family TonB-linked outer membrane protein [Phocaeicola sp.]
MLKNTRKMRYLIVCSLLCSPILIKNQNPLCASTLETLQSSKGETIKGLIVDANNEPIIGASIFVEGTSKGVITNLDGDYQISEVARGETLTISYMGYKTQKITFRGNNLQEFRIITMYEDTETLGEIQVVAFATQKKESIVSSIATVKPGELKVPSSNLTSGLAGRIAGLVSYQRSGEPGADNAEFFVRGVTSFGYSRSPLILIDGLELTSQDLARLNTDDIESFSILKDATSAALYGSRGANGVIIVTTKQGVEGKMQISARLESSISKPISQIETADPVTYMKLFNEAIATRNPLERPRYSSMQIDNTIAGVNPYVYPATDWNELMFSDMTNNYRGNISVSGGGKIARYYVAANYNRDNGNLKVDQRNNFNQNIAINRVGVRSNIGINLTKKTELNIRMNGSFDDYQGPVHDGSTLYGMVMRTSPVDFPAYFAPDTSHQYTKHILFGNTTLGTSLNPYAELVKGYRNYSRNFLSMQAELKQDLGFITEGLKFRISANTNRTSFYSSSRQYTPYYYYVDSYDRQTDEYVLFNSNPQSGKEYLNYTKGEEWTENVFYLESALNYNRTFNDVHDISGLFVYTMRETAYSAASNLITSLPYRNLGLAGRLTYGFDSRYFIEGNFGYNGSERFHKSHRWGFFPSVGGGWMVTNEKFADFINKKYIDDLKIKGSYGLVGNDQIGDVNDRFFYLSDVNLDAGSGPSFGLNMNKPDNRNIVAINRYANSNISWEIATKLNLGFEATLFKDFKLIAEYFREDRSNILQTRSSITDEIGIEVPNNVKANIGKASSQGFDGSLDYNKHFSNKMWLQLRGNFTYARGIYKEFEEPNYPDAPWLSRVGKPITQQWGYIAERLFIDENDVKNSPIQFGDYKAGDIKYRDINNDGVINFKDQVAIGHPTTPEIIYGFGFSFGYKNFDISAFFQGSGRSSFWIDQNATAPFIDTVGDNGLVENNALLKIYADNHWSETNQNIYALWPRLSASTIENNNQRSTWFMRSGSFLRLKSLEIAYNVPQKSLKKLHMSQLRVYATGSNLLTFSGFKLWDPEMAGNGLGYPLQQVFNLGLQVGF